ncbi:hypothetical protein [Frigoribacterium sp. SL97]|uniref:hypothetical protein n=1 Tax=Frigoribacterium sp. SL97 TaxID=2994664 RepID=UPI00226DC18E|nr:hypothetical protein [Frigoribacterium sp. SL97]WAC50241.1 hypothetical protein OVA02_10100 [Frigoribacterium sp. SL97]
MAFQEMDHPRTTAGLFTTKMQHGPEVELSPMGGLGSTDVRDFVAAAEVRSVTPITQDDLFEALDNEEPEKHGRVRRVRLARGLMSFDDLEVYGPYDGTPILIEVSPSVDNGHLKVMQGRAVIRVDAGHPFDVTVSGESDATVIVAANRSSMVNARDSSTVLVIAETDARGALRVMGEEATGTVVGDTGRYFLVPHSPT